ncbi:MAG: S8 family serine peptidase, partial [Actinomycetota bacterium]|nr:S8 family serine peptidase [Actinomycetota bacterium]
MVKIAFGISWNDSKKGHTMAMMTAILLAVSFASSPIATQSLARATGEMISVIVREAPGSGTAPEMAVEALGGTVTRHIGIINGFVAELPSGAVARLQASEGVHSVTLDRRVMMQHAVNGFDSANDPGSMYNVSKAIKASDLFRQGITGKGVDVAVIDTGVAPVAGMGTVVNGPDLSFDSPSPELRYKDAYGHGTHIAGIINGRDSADYNSHDPFTGVAPDSRVVNVKVAASSGATDVSQVIAAIDWVVQNRNANGANIRVLNLSFGTDGTTNYLNDPLTYAAEVAWKKGIVVVVAAGNSQFGTSKLNNPAYDPYVIAVGADDTKGTFDTSDDIVPAWSAKGDGARNPDLVAPGKSIVSLRAPGSVVDLTHPEGRVNDRLFRGSGTSQASAVVAGAAALLVSQRPNLTPDQVKALLMSTAQKLPAADATAQGSGLVNLKAAAAAPTPNSVQTWPSSVGDPSSCTCLIEPARGTVHVKSDEMQYTDAEGNTHVMPAQTLEGEIDWFGNSWSGNSWSGNSWSGNSWSGNSWSGNSWSGNSWSGNSWSGGWNGNSWSGNSWSGNSWSGNSWSGNSWSAILWTGNSWSGNSWS